MQFNWPRGVLSFFSVIKFQCINSVDLTRRMLREECSEKPPDKLAGQGVGAAWGVVDDVAGAAEVGTMVRLANACCAVWRSSTEPKGLFG